MLADIEFIFTAALGMSISGHTEKQGFYRNSHLRGQGGLHQDFVEIDFLDVSDRGD